MIFYVALDTEGKHHLVTSQVEAGKINKSFETIDIPTDKPGLRDFVQGLLDKVDLLNGQVNSLKFDSSITPVTISEASEGQPELPPVAAKAKTVTITAPVTYLSIMEWLLDTATQAQVEQVFSAIGARWVEAR